MAEATVQSVEIPDPYSMDLRDIDVSRPEIMQQNAQWDYFRAYAKKLQCTTARTVCLVRTGQLPSSTTSWRWIKITTIFLDFGITLTDRPEDFNAELHQHGPA